MKASIRFKDIYPASLFVTFLILWGLDGASNPTQSAAPSLEWSKILNSVDVKNTCQDDRHPPSSTPTCAEHGERLFSPLLGVDRDRSLELLTKLERKNNFKTQ